MAGRGGHFPPTQRFQQKEGNRGSDPSPAIVSPTVSGPARAIPEAASGPQTGMEPAGVTIKAKKPKPPHCFRCKCNGHLLEECTADLDCVICNKKNSHLTAKCPVLKLPKPDASFFGFGKNELGFFRVLDFDFKLEVPEPAPTALVKVTGGQISAEIVQGELA